MSEFSTLTEAVTNGDANAAVAAARAALDAGAEPLRLVSEGLARGGGSLLGVALADRVGQGGQLGHRPEHNGATESAESSR